MNCYHVIENDDFTAEVHAKTAREAIDIYTMRTAISAIDETPTICTVRGGYVAVYADTIAFFRERTPYVYELETRGATLNGQALRQMRYNTNVLYNTHRKAVSYLPTGYMLSFYRSCELTAWEYLLYYANSLTRLYSGETWKVYRRISRDDVGMYTFSDYYYFTTLKDARHTAELLHIDPAKIFAV